MQHILPGGGIRTRHYEDVLSHVQLHHKLLMRVVFKTVDFVDALN
jgi:hypothetical protein